jgi:hypothetical protein
MCGSACQNAPWAMAYYTLRATKAAGRHSCVATIPAA